ncbi:MAG: glycosyltransferase [Chitinophagaceae bacterium]|nr:glycosyltransferase [Anaerolineae bacterium]
MTTRFDPTRQYYDAFSKKLLADYVYGNLRVEYAIQHALRWIPSNAQHILDLGCGIGCSSWEIKRHFPQASVLGIDISTGMIEVASQLFKTEGLNYLVHNVLENDLNIDYSFDAIIMLDVYEHIPQDLNDKLNTFLGQVLQRNGRIILTCPSIPHQHFLQRYLPSGLQPVDEIISAEVMGKLARQVDGEVVYYSYASIGHMNDYLHVVIERDPPYTTKGSVTQLQKSFKLEEQDMREKRVNSHLGLRVTPAGITLAKNKDVTICIVAPQQPAYSETFIRLHMERLPANVRFLYDGWLPRRRDDGKYLLPLFVRAFQKFLSLISHSPVTRFHKSALKRFWLKNNVKVVLAEYGPAGVAVMDVCRQAGIPLVVHFFGADAYEGQILNDAGRRYPELFQKAAAIIAVSNPMKQHLIEMGAPIDKIYWNPCGADTDLFKSADPENAPPTFLAIGRFVDKKAPHLVLLAFQQVVQEIPDARLIMVGDGILWESSKILARSLNIAHAVDFLGHKSHPDLAALMQNVRGFIQHSVQTSSGDSEGTPVAVIEASASGLPVVATRHGGIVDVVIEGKTGFLVDEGDVKGMANYIIQLARTPSLAGQLGRAGQENVKQNFSITLTIDKLWEIIEKHI